jgi:hypothetical protein
VTAELIKRARERRRRRHRAIGGVLLLLGIAAALAVVFAGRGASPSNRAAAGIPSGVDRGVESISARAFAKYRLSCWALRRADIPVGTKGSSWCRPDTRVSTQSVWVLHPPGRSITCRRSSSTYACRVVVHDELHQARRT